MKIRLHDLRATGDSLLRAAAGARSEATRELYRKRAKLLESLANDVTWLDAGPKPAASADQPSSEQATANQSDSVNP
jgi:hypothetical protein